MSTGQIENVIDYFRFDFLADVSIKLDNVFFANRLPSFLEVWRHLERLFEPFLFLVFQEGIFVGGYEVRGILFLIFFNLVDLRVLLAFEDFERVRGQFYI